MCFSDRHDRGGRCSITIKQRCSHTDIVPAIGTPGVEIDKMPRAEPILFKLEIVPASDNSGVGLPDGSPPAAAMASARIGGIARI